MERKPIQKEPIQGTSSQSPSPSPTVPWSAEALKNYSAEWLSAMGDLALLFLGLAVGVSLYNLIIYLLRGGEE
jgi:hypothetical protein